MTTLENTPLTAEPQHELSTEQLRKLERKDVLNLPADDRLRWFASITFAHGHMNTVMKQLHELLDPNNDIKIIALIGPTGIGKTTLLDKCIASIVNKYAPVRLAHEVPVAVVSAPANGERSFSWKTLYRRMQLACGGVLLDQQRSAVVSNGELVSVRADRTSLAFRREMLEQEIKRRNVRVLAIDECLHLLRFGHSDAMMDTLKSLADINPGTKLLLTGTYQIADLMDTYGQLARRSEVLHYRRYKISDSPNDDSPTDDEREFRDVIRRIAEHWPCEQVPNLDDTWQTLMRASLGSVGLLKSQLTQLASLQMKRKGEVFNPKDALKAFKASKMLNRIETEIVEGEERLKGSCYGEAELDCSEGLENWLHKLGKRRA
ncbi:AAA family ATPase [Aquabacterium sp.]|uniref:ATP-binding protein n=1 Tax=Aquabacterium sp. TaxID=1872578 RepID=UPI0026271637|nr:AAA family ATPase [Aquabacterium sp.]MDD2977141.1 AAA family ATPase [Aquabacterium sp.]